MNRIGSPLRTIVLIILLLSSNTLRAQQTNSPIQRQGSRWIGVSTNPASSALRAQLLLPKNQGIVVRNVAAGSPAANAGLRKDDLLLTVENRVLTRPRDLSRLVGQSNKPRLTIEFLRAGQRHQVFVQPVTRRQAAKPMPQEAARAERPLLQALLNQLAPVAGVGDASAGNGNGLDKLLSNLPNNFQITLRRDAGGPPRFLVEREGQRWEMDGRNLNRWGQALLPLAEGLLGSGPAIPSQPPELDAGDNPIPIPEADIPLPAVELPSELTPLEPTPQNESSPGS
ncbi:MAG: PDZ domain-containing protein [Planctomycetota bacterium]|nr:PDZ domain-containing protein [Planctomycetota bacterium]